jgi:3-methyladenine DNA glycosylase/8-oxoguanine DNA glycosylase
MFGLDLDAERFYAEAARDDRVLRRLQTRMLGVRPVTAPTPLAVLVWIAIADLHGPERARIVMGRLGGGEDADDLARLDPHVDALRLGLDMATVAQLQTLGLRGQTGAFGLELLQSMPLQAARSWICSNAEVGRTTADVVLVAGAGRRDIVPHPTPQLVAAVERYYGVARAEARRRIDDLSRLWGEFATWAAYLLVEAARRDGVATV